MGKTGVSIPDEAEIAAYRQEILKRNRSSAVEEIAAKEPVVIIQYVHAILQDGIRLSESNPELEETLAFFKTTIDVMDDLKTRLETYNEKGNWSLVSVLTGLNKKKVSADLALLLEKIEKVTVTTELVSLYEEAELWLYSWYLHTYNTYPEKKRDPATGQPLKDKNGVYLAIDGEDAAFRYVIGIPQLTIAEHYRDVAKVIEAKLIAHQQNLDPKAGVVTLAAKQQDKNPAPVVSVTHAGDHAVISVTVRSLDEALLTRIKTAVTAICAGDSHPSLQTNNLQAVDKEKGWADLFAATQSMSLSSLTCNSLDEMKLEALQEGLDKYGLTESQKSQLGRLKQNIEAQFNSYKQNTYSMPLVGTVVQREHAGLVNSSLGKIKRTTDPNEMLQILYAMRNDLIRKNSEELLPKVNKLLLNAYNGLQRLDSQNRFPHAVEMR